MTIVEMAQALREADLTVKETEKTLKEYKAVRDEMNRDLAAAMLEEEMQSVKTAGTNFFIQNQRFVNYDKTKEEDFFQALRSAGYGGIIQETINANTLKSTVTKEIMSQDENGNDVLPEWADRFISIVNQPKIGMRKV